MSQFKRPILLKEIQNRAETFHKKPSFSRHLINKEKLKKKTERKEKLSFPMASILFKNTEFLNPFFLKEVTKQKLKAFSHLLIASLKW